MYHRGNILGGGTKKWKNHNARLGIIEYCMGPAEVVFPVFNDPPPAAAEHLSGAAVVVV